MLFRSLQFPNANIMGIKFLGGVGEAHDKDTIEKLLGLKKIGVYPVEEENTAKPVEEKREVRKSKKK